MSAFEKRLRAVWSNDPPKRYLPRSFHGGTGWGVFDVKEGRFLEDAEVKKIELESLLTEVVSH